MLKKLFFLAAVMLSSIGLWADGPAVGTQFQPSILAPKLKYEVTSAGEINTVKVIANKYSSASITIPASVTYQSVTYSVTEIGSNAFKSCSQVTSITLPEGLQTIGDSAFYSCAFSSITIPASVTSIGRRAFGACSSLSSVTFGANSQLKTIGQRAFAGCLSLATITLPEGLQTIGEGAFNSCNFSSITIPASVTEIGENAFSACSYMYDVSVNWTSNPTIPGNDAFVGVALGAGPSAATIHVPAGTYSMYKNANMWKDFLIDDPAAPKVGDQFVDETSGLKFEVTAVGETNTVMVIALNNDPENDGGGYEESSYNIPVSVTYNDVTFAVTEIGDYAFYVCYNLYDVTVNWTSNLPTIGEGVFDGIADGNGPMSAILHVPAGTKTTVYNVDPWNTFGTIDDPIPHVGDQFEDATSGLMFEITAKGDTNSVKVISRFGEAASEFGGGYQSTTYTIPEKVTHKNVELTVTKIEEFAFDLCSDLESITIPASVTEMGEAAFMHCLSLTSIILPDELETIGYGVFWGCGLTSIDIPASVTTIGEQAFCSCEQLSSVILHDGMKTIEKNMFAYCSSLTSITIPASVTTIEYSAFYGCFALASIDIPASVITIGERAFGSCTALKDVYVNWTSSLPTISSDVFHWIAGGEDHGPQDATLHVPAGYKSLYENAYIWQDFGEIVDDVPVPAPVITFYTRDNLTNGQFGTICLPYASASVEGAKFYTLNYYDGGSNLYVDEVTELAAGMPYIFEATATSFTVTYGDMTTPASAGNYNGLYGALEATEMTSDATDLYAGIANNAIAVANSGYKVTVAANRAYINLNEVPRTQGNNAPARAIGVSRGQTTDLELEQAEGNADGKYIMNGRFVIIKDGKAINALGM